MNRSFLALITGIILFFNLAPATAQTPNGTGNKGTVVNGTPAGNGYPFFCSLTPAAGTGVTNFSPECGASLIAPQWVLTAGHCIVDFSRFPNEVVYDSIDVVVATSTLTHANANTVRVRGDYIVKHQGFSLSAGDYAHDLALIHLRTPVTIAPIALPQQGDNSLSRAGRSVKGIGYGIWDTVTLGSPDTLQIVDIKIIHNDTCNTADRYDNTVGTGMICAGVLTGRATGNAAGDSGGPLFVDSANTRVQVGIVSWGDGPYATSAHPGIYTRISSYRRWIDSVINAHDHPTAIPHPGEMPKTNVYMAGHIMKAQFETPLQAGATCALYDIAGKVIANSQIMAGTSNYELVLPPVAGGLYIFRVMLQNGASGQYKVTVRE